MESHRIAHERGFLSFVLPRFRDRYGLLLDTEKGRVKLLRSFGHFEGFDSRHEVAFSPRKSAREIGQLLTRRGAPDDCYVLSELAETDGQLMKLTDALEATVGSGFGTFISCLPGELGFFEDEEKQVLLRYASSSR